MESDYARRVVRKEVTASNYTDKEIQGLAENASQEFGIVKDFSWTIRIGNDGRVTLIISGTTEDLTAQCTQIVL